MMGRSGRSVSFLCLVLVLCLSGHQIGNRVHALLHPYLQQSRRHHPGRGLAGSPCERRAHPTSAHSHNPSLRNERDNERRIRVGSSSVRRDFLRQAARAVAVTTTVVGLDAVAPTARPSRRPKVASAYDKTFPDELNSSDGVMDERQRRINQILEREQLPVQMQAGQPTSEINRRRPGSYGSAGLSSFSVTPLGSAVWAGALWLLSGSRSNPLATPLANALYNETHEQWLQDRNDGLFANLPLPLLGILGLGFVLAGMLVDGTVSALAGPDKDSSLQLAGVTLIGGATLELGRVASGEKRLTRSESDRESLLGSEFRAFADSRLQRGGTCHRLDVVRAFRRYYAKYRQPDNPEYPLSDLEIEQLLRSWSRQFAGVEMSSAGFYNGIKINQDADVFTS